MLGEIADTLWGFESQNERLVLSMSLKVLCRIKLPYIIRLQKSKTYTVSLDECPEFSMFNISFYPNGEVLGVERDREYDDDVCTFLEVEAVIKKFDYNSYKAAPDVDYTLYDVPNDDRSSIFEIVKERLNDFLKYLQNTSNMFWIEGLSINPISGVIGIGTEFSFLKPDQIVYPSTRYWVAVRDNYMVGVNSNTIKPISDELLERYNTSYLVNQIWSDYLLKACKAMYQSEYENFIIYCAISAESFIKQLTQLNFENDIVLQKLVEAGKNQMVDTYFKVIVKYLYGKNLLEIEECLYENLMRIFKLRNEIMHRGILDEQALQKAGLLEINFKVCESILERLERAIKEILKLLG